MPSYLPRRKASRLCSFQGLDSEACVLHIVLTMLQFAGYIVYANTGIDDSLFVVYQQWCAVHDDMQRAGPFTL
eukprot:6248538-Amphidinium_carterae.1